MNRRTMIKTSLAAMAAPIYLPFMQSGGGSVVSDTPSLLAAYAAAPAGSTITLRGGVYTNKHTYWSSPLRQCCFYLNKAITLEAYPGETPILTFIPGDPPIMDSIDYGPIVLAAANVILRGLTIIGTRALGDSPGGQDTDVNVQVQNGCTVTLDSCTIQQFGHCGVKALTGVIHATNCLISDGGFTGRDHCIYISAASYAGRSIIQGCELARAAGYGVHLYGTPQRVGIISCNVHHNGGTYTPANGGGILIGGPNCLIQDCQITDNTGYGGLVLWKATSTGGAYLHNTILRNTGTGNIVLDQAGPNTVYQNTRNATIWTNTTLAPWQDDGTDTVI